MIKIQGYHSPRFITARATSPGAARIIPIFAFQPGTVMEAERINAVANRIADLLWLMARDAETEAGQH